MLFWGGGWDRFWDTTSDIWRICQTWCDRPLIGSYDLEEEERLLAFLGFLSDVSVGDSINDCLLNMCVEVMTPLVQCMDAVLATAMRANDQAVINWWQEPPPMQEGFSTHLSLRQAGHRMQLRISWWFSLTQMCNNTAPQMLHDLHGTVFFYLHLP